MGAIAARLSQSPTRMAERVTVEQAAERVRPRDSMGLPLGPGQPPGFLRALGEREDWQDLRVAGALLVVGTALFTRPGVHYLSGFFGPLERALRDQDFNIGFTPADFRRLAPLLEDLEPRVMATSAAPPDDDGFCSLSLHAGGTFAELRRAGEDPDRLLVVEASPKFPRTRGLPPEFPHSLHISEIDLLIESDDGPLAFPEPALTETDKAIAAACQRLRRGRGDGADRDRLDPVGDRRAAGRGRRVGLRRSLRDVHRRADAAASRRQGRQSQGPVRRRQRRHLRDGHRRTCTRGWRTTTRSRSCRSRWSTRPM